MIPADETFDGTFPFQPHFSDAPGFRMHYVDEGDGEPVVCLHGEPTWGYIYRKFIPPLSTHHRVVVPDHMGFGKSETPQDREYTLSTHVENLEAVLLELDLRDITLVMQDWGGLIGGGFALRHADRIKRLCFINTTAPLGLPIEQEIFPKNLQTPWFQWVKKANDEGTLEQVLGNLGVTALSVMKLLGFENSAVVDETWIRAYGGHFRTKADCLGAINFPLDFLTGKWARFYADGVGNVEAVRQKPAMLVEGMRDRAIFPDVVVAHCQEDAPETAVALIEQFLQLT
jgi:pimeloyl-ACP methyl ester carboxylesterase